MDNKEIIRKILIDVMDLGYLNEFISIIFDYELNENDFIYAQYKVVNNDVIIEIYDNNIVNRFNVYIFTYDNSLYNLDTNKDDNTSITYIYINNCYKSFINNNKLSNLEKFGALFNTKNKSEFISLTTSIFSDNINDIIEKEEFSL